MNNDLKRNLNRLASNIRRQTQEASALAAYHRLHDMLSDMIEGGRLREADIPDDYAALVHQLTICANQHPQRKETCANDAKHD